MKSKCSFILKATTALVLCFLMLFGTVTTSLAAVVENADTGAEADVADEGAAVEVADEGADVEVADEGAESDLAETGATVTLYYQKDMPSGNYSASNSATMTQSSKNDKKYYANISLQNGSYGFYVKWGNDYYKASATATSDQNVQLWKYGSTNYGNSNHRVTYSTGAAANFVFTFDTSDSNNYRIAVRPTTSTTVKMAWSTASGHDGDYNLGTYDTMTHTSNGLYTKDLTLTAVKHYMFIQTNNTNYYRAANTLTQNSETSVGKMYYYGTSNYGNSSDKVNFTPSAAGKYRFTYDIKDQTVTMYRLYDITYNNGTTPTGGGAISGTTPSAQLKVHGTNVTLAGNVLSSTGYTQDGWSTSDNSSTRDYAASASYSTNASLSLYPHWNETMNTVTFTKKLGTASATTLGTANAGVATKASYTASSETGYDFTGWTITSGSTNASNTSLSGATASLNASGAVTVQANYTLKTYAITLSESGATGGTLKVDGSDFTSGSTVAHGSHTFSVTAPDGMNIKSISGIGTWSISGNTATLGSTSITEAKEITVVYESAGTCGFTLSASSGSVNIGATTSFTATPNSYHSSGTISVSSSDTSVATVSKSGNTYTVTGVAPGTATITVSCTDTGNSPATYTVTVNTPTISVADQSGKKIGDTYTITPTLTNPSTTGSGWTVVYTAADSSILSISGNSITRNKTGSCLVTASFRYNGVEKASKTFQNTYTDPTLSFATGTAKTMNVGETYTDVATGGNIGSSATGTVTYASDATAVATVSSAGVVTAKTPGEANITATYTVTCNSQTTTKTATYKVTVATPTVTFADFSLAKGDSKDLSGSATTSNPSGLTIAYSLKSAVTGVSISGSTVSVASSCTASSATVVASAENSAGTVVATAEATLTIEDPEMTITDINDGDTIYTTIGTNVSKSISNNFSGSYTITYNGSESTSSVATAAVDNGTLTITPEAKGTVEITVTASKESAVGASPDLLINKLNLVATGADVTGSLVGTGISASQTFTVNVADVEDTFILFHENGANNWNQAYIYLEYSDGTTATALTKMTALGADEYSHTVYGYKISAEKYAAVSKVVFCKDSFWPSYDKDNAWKQTNDYVVSTSNPMKHGFYKNGQDSSQCYKYNVATFNTEITVPQVQIDDASTPLGVNYTMPATKVTEASVGKYKWTSATTSAATVTADTGTTASTTVVPVDAGSSLITVKAYAPQPTGWNAWEWADIVAGTDTATITVTADDKTVATGMKLSLDGTDYDTVDPTGAGTVTAVPSAATVAHGTSVTFTATANAGYKFVGWKVNDGAIEKTSTATKTIAIRENTTVYALFDKGVNVTFNDSTTFSSTTLKAATFTYDGAVPAAPSDPSHNGYSFTGWSSDGGTTTYTTANLPALSNPTSAITYVAQYTHVDYSVSGSVKVTTDGSTYTTSSDAGTLAITNTDGTAISHPNAMTYGDKVKLVATEKPGYTFVGLYRVRTGGTEELVQTAAGTTEVDGQTVATATCNEYTINTDSEPSYVFEARFKKQLYITLYNSYENKNGKWVFVAAPPKKVEVGSGATKRTYTYASGTDEQRGEENIKTESGAYYEGNKLLVYPGEKIALTYAGLASSDMIKGAFYNNAIRYSTEAEPDNYYVGRSHEAQNGQLLDNNTADYPHGRYLSGDDDTEYNFELNTTLYAYPSYYTTSGYYDTVTANESHYVADIDQSEHTITWTAASDYLNIDLELSTKYQLHINGDDWSGLTIENMNDEGYYYQEEAFDKSVAPATDKQFKISIDNESDATGSYAFTGIGAEVSLNPDHPEPATGMAVTAKKSDGTDASTASEISYFLVSGNMPLSNVYITLPIEKTYLMKLSNTVATDSIDNKMMITQTTSNSISSGTAPASYTGQVGTISAIPTYNNVEGSDISSDGNYWVNYTANADYKGKVYNSNNYANTGYYLAGGVNKSGTGVTAGTTIQYAFTYASGMDTKYSFVGWFEGSWSGDAYTVDYSKKLSGKTQFTYTPTKNTTVIAVVTRDLYLGGNFTSDGAYTTTSGEKTWSSNRILMEYDPTFVGSNGDKGRYYYTFDTVNTNTEYQFRVYDTKSGTEFGDLTVWNAHLYDIAGYKNDDSNHKGIADYRSKYQYDDDNTHWTTHGGFMFTTNTNQSFSEIKVNGTAMSANDLIISQNHTANGYGNPVTVYFYAYNSATSVESTYQWSRAYVSEGRGIDVLDASKGDEDAGKYNAPTASVANKTVNNQDVTVTAQATKYGNGNNNGKYEKIYECVVKEKDGQIVVTASPNDANVELQAFLVYNIETKKSEAVLGPFTTSGSGAAKTYTGNVTIPQNSKIYVVPIYKFTDAYIADPDGNPNTDDALETHTVYVRTDDIDKNVWGGLVAMYSWGTNSAYNSGGWPGQLMIPSDDGNSFYAPLTFTKNGLAGVTFNNYHKRYGSGYCNFVGSYKDKGVSDVSYSSDTTHVYQAYDYREPVSIIDNINAGGIYDSDDMDLTFALKSGNMTGAPTIDSAGSGAYSRADSFEYLTDRSGKYRVDLNGNKISTNPTETYRVIAWYTDTYKNGGSADYNFVEGTRDGTDYVGEYSINWTVYNTSGETVLSDSYLSAAYTDVYKSEMLTYIASEMIANDLPVSGKAVKIAYENPGTWSEAIRYAGQWYADGVNSLIQANVRVGVYSDGAWLPSDTNAPGYATATVRYDDLDTSIGEGYETESGCSGHSLINVTKTHATNRLVSFTVDDTNNFLGWYKYNETTEEYEPVNSSYKNATITPSFNSDITYYAFYSAQASYRVQYTGRDGSTKYFTAKGTDLTPAELATANQYLDDTERASDISTKLAKASDIRVFNKSYSITLSSPTKTAYTLTYTAVQSDATYRLTVYAYNDEGSLVLQSFDGKDYIEGTFNTEINLTSKAGKSLIENHPDGQQYFQGWVKYDPSRNSFDTEIISTQALFGYSLTEDLTIAPVFASTKRSDEGTWAGYVDKNVITQELTAANTGIIYNDSILSFRYSAESQRKYTEETGIVIFAQANTATEAQKTAFEGILTSAKAKTYLDHMKSNNLSSAKLSSIKYGEAYVFYIETEELSALNRVDIFQKLDYAKFSGGRYMVAGYYGSTTRTISEVVTGDYTPHDYSRITGITNNGYN